MQDTLLRTVDNIRLEQAGLVEDEALKLKMFSKIGKPLRRKINSTDRSC